MFSAGAVSATLSGNFSPAGFMAFDSAMKKAKGSMNDAEKKMTSSGGKMNKAMVGVAKGGAVALGAGLLAVGAAVAKSVSLAADFEQQLSRLKATSGATGKEMQTLKKDAMAAGAATKYSALDAAKAQTELAKGGLTVAQIHGGALKASLALAAAGELELAAAAETTVNALKQFGLGGNEAMHVADALATAANTTTTDVGELGMALRQGGGIAAMAGASFDETVATLSALADASVKGSDAGTSMKSFFLNIATPSKQARDAMKELGMSIFETTGKNKGDLKSLPDIADNLRESFGKLTKEQFLNKAGVIAGSDAARALFALYKAGGAGMESYIAKQQQAGTATATAAQKQDNLRGKIENLKGSLETAGIALGEGLLPSLTEGAEKLTATINEMAASGALEDLGRDMGDVTSGLIAAGPAIAESFKVGMAAIGPAVKVAQGTMLGLLFPLAAAAKLVLGLGKAFNAISGTVGGPKIDLGGLDKASKQLDGLITRMSRDMAGVKGPTIKIKGDSGELQAALARVRSMQVGAKTVKILAKDVSVASKIKELRALGIPPKIARILANNADAIAKTGSVEAALAQIRDKTVNVFVNTHRTITDYTATTKTSSRSPARRGARAAGRGPGGSEIALTGEGKGGELVGNPVDGWSWVDQPTLVSLGPNDAVVPSDPRYAGPALGYMFAAMGVPGYAKGKAPKKKRAAPGTLPIPAAVQFGAVPEDELNTSRDQARDSYQKRKERVRDLDVDVRAQKRKVSEAKGAKAKNAARRKLRDLERDRRRYREGGDGLQSLAAMRERWKDLQRQATALSQYNREIERLNVLQETDRGRMATASKVGDRAGWATAKGRRGGILATLRDKYAKALKLAKPGSLFAAELEGKLAGVEGEIADVGVEAFPDAESPFEGGLTKDERDTLAGLQAAQSLAALTAGTADDQAAAGATESFLTTMLGRAMADPSRGGAAAIRDLADQVASARANVASFSAAGPTGNDNADLQAQLEQQREVNRLQLRESEINRLGLATFRGTGDIGMGGPRIVINTLHPGDPDTLRAIGDAAVGGMSLQGSVSSSSTNLGI